MKKLNMTFKKILILGSILFITACTIKTESDLYLPKGQNSVQFSLDEYSRVNLYDVTEPLFVNILAGENKKFIIGGKEFDNYSWLMSPNQSKNIIFDIKEDDKIWKENFLFFAFKSTLHPINQSKITKQSGKYTTLIGYKYHFSIPKKQNSVLVDLFEYSPLLPNYFEYVGDSESVKVVLKPPYGHEFIFSNEQTTDSYSFDLYRKKEIELSINTRLKNSSTVYRDSFSRKFGFKLQK